jgi:TAP-like protein
MKLPRIAPSLLLNFGGRGVSGEDRVEGFGADIATTALLAAYDIVGFDSRGVGDSSAMECVDDPAMDVAAEQLDSGRRLTWVGEGHAAYEPGDRCIQDAVDAYLLDGALPAQGSTC